MKKFLVSFEDENLHKMLKVKAANTDKSMNFLILKSIEKELKNDVNLQQKNLKGL